MIDWECYRRRIGQHEAYCFVPEAGLSGHALLYCLMRFVLGQLNAVNVAGHEYRYSAFPPQVLAQGLVYWSGFQNGSTLLTQILVVVLDHCRIEDHVSKIIEELYNDPTLRQVFGLRGSIRFENHSNTHMVLNGLAKKVVKVKFGADELPSNAFSRFFQGMKGSEQSVFHK
jgi:hypothetical protein